LLAHSNARAGILVEGWSDQAAVETLARRLGQDLKAQGIIVVPVGGFTNMAKFAQALGRGGLNLRLSALCDAAEASHVADQLLGRTNEETRDVLESVGLFVCEADLEDELIRALGRLPSRTS
jgi:predicted ATP-dependent endonuclease of OLD family